MQHLQHGMNSVSKVEIRNSSSFASFKRNFKICYFLCLLTGASPSAPLATARASDSVLRLTTCALQMLLL